MTTSKLKMAREVLFDGIEREQQIDVYETCPRVSTKIKLLKSWQIRSLRKPTKELERLLPDWKREIQRTVNFMDASRLKGSRAMVSVFGSGRLYSYPPGDHSLMWRDSERKYIWTTEPYEAILHDSPTEENASLKTWMENNGWQWAIRKEWGMWNPRGGTTLYICSPPTPRGANLTEILSRVDLADWEFLGRKGHC